MADSYRIGQRWVSETEPELGLGSISELSVRTVTVSFAAVGEQRQYARDNAPLRRARFRAGDQISRADGTDTQVVQSVSERDGFLVYHTERGLIPEKDVNARLSFGTPEQRLFSGQTDSLEAFALRVKALENQHRRRQSPVRGFVGGRIDLILHQLYIASEVARRLQPRVLLADEVGLGKTIEAGLILHRLLQTRRVGRALVLVPEPLVHQWFVELLRRFNLWFHIFDEERCDAIETANPETNPFLDDQWVLCGLAFLMKSPRRAEQLVSAGWDIVVIDEAHHLGWSPQGSTPEYSLAEALAKRTPALLLLTATPEQLGYASHFARLRLLDPDRYFDFDQFLQETHHYREVAAVADKLVRELPLAEADLDLLARILARSKEALRSQLTGPARRDLISDLLDQHGTGRVMFRNTRAAIPGFPQRRPVLYPLPAPTNSERIYVALAAEFAADTSTDGRGAFQPAYSTDPRIPWLAEFLRAHSNEKVLLICRSETKVEALASALTERINVKIALFHEQVPLVQRDRNAAWFAEEDGAQILLASEIGSEGRNFQFAHHLVLFDLPLDPELLEQRIGRLDRIGQRSEINVHVPYVVGSPQEVLARWYHEGLNAFALNLRAGRQVLESFGSRVLDLAQDFHETQDSSRASLTELIHQSRAASEQFTAQLEQGRDHLLELNSFRPEPAKRLVHAIQSEDEDSSLTQFMLAVFDAYAIQAEEIAPRTYHLGSAGVFADTFPGLPPEGFTVTTSRSRALTREDVQFLTWDHPLVTGALDLILGSTAGNSAFAHWPDSRHQSLYFEAVFVLECIAPAILHADRFLPPTPVRVIVDQQGTDAQSAPTSVVLGRELKAHPPFPFLDQEQVREELLPGMLAAAERIASKSVGFFIARAQEEMNRQVGHEIARLEALRKVNPNIRAQEIELLVQHQRQLNEHLGAARLRLDAVRLIRRGPNQ